MKKNTSSTFIRLKHSISSLGSTGPGGADFLAFRDEAAQQDQVEFFTSVADLPPVPEGRKRLALISGRTADNPRFLNEAIQVRIYY